MPTDIKTLYQQSLRNTLAAEKQGLVQMRAQRKGLDDYPDYAAALDRHVAATEQQIARLDRAIEETGAGSGALREAVTQAAGAVGAAVHGVMPDATLKNLYAGYAFQHEQIAAYTSLEVIASAAGYASHKAWIEQSIKEERTAADAIDAIIGSVTQRFLDRQGA